MIQLIGGRFMATMIPSFPYGFKPESHEDEMFSSLQKLPQDYYVFYSFTLGEIINGTWKEKEIDFLIYQRELGIMVIEAKAGQVWCDRGIWRYGSGIEMKDPFKQADTGRWNIYNKLRDLQRYDNDPIFRRCKIHFAVWFPSISKKSLDKIVLPAGADKKIILTAEDIIDPRPKLEEIFSYDILNDDIVTDLSDRDHKFLMEDFLCPEFKILPQKSFEFDYQRKRFDAMIVEQYNILNYLEYQKTAVINGAAGTGKTMIAIEKARRHSESGENVLFLCFNSKLKEHLETAYPYKNVSYYTIDGFACKLCISEKADFERLCDILMECSEKPDTFPYSHIIVDEGQDFGQERINASFLFMTMEEIVSKKVSGSFYVFYDKNQLIQSKELPEYIAQADCRLTLYKNCRNTKRIADTSLRPLRLNKPAKVLGTTMNGDMPTISFCSINQTQGILDKVIYDSIYEGMNNIQIITCSTNEKSIFSNRVKDEQYINNSHRIPFTTVRKFKGLEAEHIIMVDIDKHTFTDESLLFYVGASRAKFRLTIIANMDENECAEVITSFKSIVKRNDPKETLTKILGCKQLIH